MELLFGGNTVILLFWVYINFIIEVKEKYKKIILMYIITYIASSTIKQDKLSMKKQCNRKMRVLIMLN